MWGFRAKLPGGRDDGAGGNTVLSDGQQADAGREFLSGGEFPAWRRPIEAFRGQAVEDFPVSARNVHVKELENPGVGPPSGQKKPELPGPVLVAPQNARHQEGPAGEGSMEMEYGIARAIEDLRRLWLSLVPVSNARQRVLPGMRNETAGVSTA